MCLFFVITKYLHILFTVYLTCLSFPVSIRFLLISDTSSQNFIHPKLSVDPKFFPCLSLPFWLYAFRHQPSPYSAHPNVYVSGRPTSLFPKLILRYSLFQVFHLFPTQSISRLVKNPQIWTKMFFTRTYNPNKPMYIIWVRSNFPFSLKKSLEPYRKCIIKGIFINNIT